VNLAKDFAAAAVKRVRCRTCQTLIELTPNDRDALLTAIADHALSIRLIVEVCAKNGVAVNTNGIYRHRHGLCPTS